MREILFRGKREDNGEWVEGYYVCVSGVKHYILTGNPVIAPNNITIECYGVIPETVGQYTGLKDKNGKRIFEHDVVRRFNSKGKEIMRYIVKWCDDCCIFVLSYCGDDMGYDTDFTVFSGTELEVIGNETDNPELLGGDDT